MLRRVPFLIAVALALFCYAAFAQTNAREGSRGYGSPDVFLARYLEFRDHQLRSADPDILTVRLGYVKGVTRAFTGVAGVARIDLATGAVTATLSGLKPREQYRLQLQRLPEDGATLRAFDAGALRAVSATATVAATLPASGTDFAVDRIALVAADGETLIAVGSVGVMQKIFFRRLSLVNESTGVVLLREPTTPPRFSMLVPDLTQSVPSGALARSLARQEVAAIAIDGASAEDSESVVAAAVSLDSLIAQGQTLFAEKTFSGNGRTCATCHPANHNFTIDVPFIATLPPTDPLFIAETNSALSQLEKPALMRQFGLILENIDGLSAPTTKFVMRSVPHTLGLPTSLTKDPSLPPAEMTGWSGDGAPGAGSLRDFATGAVTQHFTKTLARVPGVDFVLPTQSQLDAMEAFQRSLGRATDFNLAGFTFTDPSVETGKQLFVNGNGGGKCAGCHGNAGALIATGQNLNFNTNVEDVVNPARAVLPFPIDGGFGATPANLDGSFGNRTFNAPPVVEAADTAPFFHNNFAQTLGDVVDFYTSNVFNGPRAPTAQFNFNATERAQLVSFMRGINTLQNIDVVVRELNEIVALQGNPKKEIDERFGVILSDTDDAIGVLNAGAIFPTAVTQLTTARQAIVSARAQQNKHTREQFIQQALTALAAARAAIAT